MGWCMLVVVIKCLLCVAENVTAWICWLICNTCCWPFVHRDNSGSCFSVKKKKNSLFQRITVILVCYYKKKLLLWFIGIHVVNVGCVLSIHVCTKNITSFLLIAVKASNFARKFANKFYTSLCLDFVHNIMALWVMAMEIRGPVS